MTEHRPRIDATQAQGAFLVEQCDVPAEMTLCEWRRAKAQADRDAREADRLKRGWRRVLRRAA